MNCIELYTYWRNRICKLGDASLIDRFDAAVATTTQFPKQNDKWLYL
ncbi:hypothetical protein [Larkinella arboricola]|nr:hypothetical protein [Larkinella arboricola]